MFLEQSLDVETPMGTMLESRYSMGLMDSHLYHKGAEHLGHGGSYGCFMDCQESVWDLGDGATADPLQGWKWLKDLFMVR